jgi:hypothetical protein
LRPILRLKLGLGHGFVAGSGRMGLNRSAGGQVLRECGKNMTLCVNQVTPDQIGSFMQDVIRQYQDVSPEGYRRADPRETVAIPIRVQPLNDQYQAAGEPFSVVTRDMSCSGIGFFHTQPVALGRIRICLKAPASHEEMNLLARVEHCTSCGDFFIVGCRIENVTPA